MNTSSVGSLSGRTHGHLMRFFALSLLLLCTGHSLFAQVHNWVPNPGFESYSECPTFNHGFNGLVDTWFNGTTGGNPQYYNSCDVTGNCGRSVPYNGYGYQDQRTPAGHAYASIFNYDNGSTHYREYIKVRLWNPTADPVAPGTLISGTTYKVKFFVSLAEASRVGIRRIGAYLTSDASVPSTSSVYTESGSPVSPQIAHADPITDMAYNVVGGWTEVIGYFTATGTEQYLVIGCFDESLSTEAVTPHGDSYCGNLSQNDYGDIAAVYYIDDAEVSPTQPCKCNYDITMEPKSSSDPTKCCFTLSVQPGFNACPLYGIKILAPTNDPIVFDRSGNPGKPNPLQDAVLTTLGDFCVNQITGSQSVVVQFLDDGGDPMCQTIKDLKCQCDCSSLKVRVVRDYINQSGCCYSVYLDNPGTCSVSASELRLRIPPVSGQGFVLGATNGAWHTVTTTSSVTFKNYQGATPSSIVAPHASIYVGQFCSQPTTAPQSVNWSFSAAGFQSQNDPGICGGSTAIFCSTTECCANLKAELRPLPHVIDHSGQPSEEIKCCYELWVSQKTASSQCQSFMSFNIIPDFANDASNITTVTMDALSSPITLTTTPQKVGTVCFSYLIGSIPIKTWGATVKFMNGSDVACSFHPDVPDCIDVWGGGDPSGKPVLFPVTSRPSLISGIPIENVLSARPNPSRGETTISYHLAIDGSARLELFDLAGRVVEKIEDRFLSKGDHVAHLNTAGLAAGVYHIRLTYGGDVIMIPVTVIH
ncbi:MAG: hypothetical protein JWQ98_2791 [Chlorobi bacterium]|nr:hypothetical protein [Chlorobiota bacterium]